MSDETPRALDPDALLLFERKGLEAGLGAPQTGIANAVKVRRIMQLTRGSQWRPVATLPLNFPTHHPQGMVRVGERLYVTSVEIIEATQRYPALRDGLDRSAGRGRGHLFEIDLQGNLQRQITLGEGDVYHPGGIDYDGRNIWVPVAEYRPNSRAIVYAGIGHMPMREIPQRSAVDTAAFLHEASGATALVH